jgi:hypothetical protein
MKKKEGLLPPRLGEENAFSVSDSGSDTVPVLVDVGGVKVEMSPSNALALAGRIVATVECWMRSRDVR